MRKFVLKPLVGRYARAIRVEAIRTVLERSAVMNVVILDTSCANLSSVKSAVARHGCYLMVRREGEIVLRADKLFCPASVRRRPLWINCANVDDRLN